MSKMLGITVCFVKVSLSKIKFQDVFCDAIQPLFGTEVFAQEIIDLYPTAHLIGTNSI